MRAILVSLKMFIKQLLSDSMLLMILFVPIIAGVAFKFGVPALKPLLMNWFQVEDIFTPFYRLIDFLLIVLVPYMFNFACIMTLLDEYDQGIIKQLTVTPVMKNGIVISRIGLLTFIGMIYAYIIGIFFTLTNWHPLTLLIYSFLCGVLSMIMSFLIFTFSKNKIEGMAIAKLSGIFLLGIFVPFFVSSNLQYFAAFLPSFWLAKMVLNPSLFHLLIGVSVFVFWFLILHRKFLFKLSKK